MPYINYGAFTERIAKLEQELADTKARAERHYDRLLATQRSLARERERAETWKAAQEAGCEVISNLKNKVWGDMRSGEELEAVHREALAKARALEGATDE